MDQFCKVHSQIATKIYDKFVSIDSCLICLWFISLWLSIGMLPIQNFRSVLLTFTITYNSTQDVKTFICSYFLIYREDCVGLTCISWHLKIQPKFVHCKILFKPETWVLDTETISQNQTWNFSVHNFVTQHYVNTHQLICICASWWCPAKSNQSTVCCKKQPICICLHNFHLKLWSKWVSAVASVSRFHIKVRCVFILCENTLKWVKMWRSYNFFLQLKLICLFDVK